MRPAGHEPRVRLLCIRFLLFHCPAELCAEEDAEIAKIGLRKILCCHRLNVRLIGRM